MKGLFLFAFFHFMSLLLSKQLSEEVSRATFRNEVNPAIGKGNFVQQTENRIQLDSAQPPMLIYVPETSCHVFLSQDFGEFSPPVHMDNSLTNIWCNWTIWAGPGKHIVVYIKNFIANEDCDKSEDKIVFEGVSSTVENTVVYACWNKITHVFAAQASAVHVVFLSRSSSRKRTSKYFHGSYYVFKDHGTDVSTHHPLFPSILLPTPVRKIKYSIDTKIFTKAPPLLSSFTGAAKPKEIKYSDKISILMQQSSAFLAQIPIMETILSSDSTTAATTTTSEQIMLPSLSTPYICGTTVNIEQSWFSTVLVTKELRELTCLTDPKVYAPPSSLSLKTIPTPANSRKHLPPPVAVTTFVNEVGYINDTTQSAWHSLFSVVSASASLGEMDHVSDIKSPSEQLPFYSAVAPVTIKEDVIYARGTKTYMSRSSLSSPTASAYIREMSYTSAYETSVQQSLFSSYGREMDYIGDSKISIIQPLFSSVSIPIASLGINFFTDHKASTEEVDYICDIKPSVEETLLSSIAASVSVREMDSSSGIKVCTRQPQLPSMVNQAELEEKRVSSHPPAWIEKKALSSLIIPTPVEEINYISISKSAEQHFFSTSNISTSVKKLHYIRESKAAAEQPRLASVVASMAVKEMYPISKIRSLVQPPLLFPITYSSTGGANHITDPKYFTEQATHPSLDLAAATWEKTCSIKTTTSEIPTVKGDGIHAHLTATTQSNDSQVHHTYLYDEGRKSFQINLQSTLRADLEQEIKGTFLTQGHDSWNTYFFQLQQSVHSLENDPIEENHFKSETHFAKLNRFNEKPNTFGVISDWETIYLDWMSKIPYVSTPYLSATIKPVEVPNAGIILQLQGPWSKMEPLTGIDELNSEHAEVNQATFSILQMMSQNMMENREQTDLPTNIKSFSSVTSSRHSEIFHVDHSVYEEVANPSLLFNSQPVTKTQTGFLGHLQLKSVVVGSSKEKDYPDSPYQESEQVDLHLVLITALELSKVRSLRCSRLNDFYQMELGVTTVAANNTLKDDLTSRVSVGYSENILDTDLHRILPSRTVQPTIGSLPKRTDVQQQISKIEGIVSNQHGLENLSTGFAEQVKNFQDKKPSQLVSEDASVMSHSEYTSKYTINESSSEIFPLFRAWLNDRKTKTYERAREFAFQRFGNLNEDITPPLGEVDEIHINDKPYSKILPSSPLFSNLEETAAWSKLSMDIGIRISHGESTSHVYYSFSDMVSQNITYLEMGDNQDDLVAMHTPWGNGTALDIAHSPGDVLFEVVIEIEHPGLIPNSSNEVEKALVEFVKLKIKEELFFLSRQNEIKLLQTLRPKALNMVLSFWIQLKPERGNMTQAVKSHFDMLANSTVGNGTATLVSLSIEDVDECTLTVHMCDKQAMCLNEFGTYSCLCKKGYEDRSPAKSGTVCVISQQSGFGFPFRYLEILTVVPLCAIVLLLTVLAILCGLAQKKYAKEAVNLKKRDSPRKDPAEKSEQKAVPLSRMHTSEYLTCSSFPRAQLATIEEHTSGSESDNSKRLAISVEQTVF